MKNYILGLLIGFFVLLIGISCFYLETMNFKYENTLTDSFPLKTEQVIIKVEDNKKYRITNSGSDENIILKIDNNLKNEIKINSKHADTSKINYSINNSKHLDEEILHLRFSSNLDLNIKDIKPIIGLTIDGLKNKTIYDYSILKGNIIEVNVNEENASKIEFVNSKEDIYLPYNSGDKHE